MSTPLRALAEHGQSPWIDYLSRNFIQHGKLHRLKEQGVTGVTSNPTIFQQAVSESDVYDEQLAGLARMQPSAKEIFLGLARDDIRDACDELSDVFVHGHATDGWVSLEVDPALADDTVSTVDEARRLHRLVDRPNLFVKIPGTAAGLPAIEECIAAGIPINVTLLFSLDRHRQAAQAYLRGLRRLRAAGGELAAVKSVASFFVSRVDTEADQRIEQRGGPDDLKGALAVANAKLAYQNYRELFRGPEWDELAAAGATPQYCLWASTSTKNPAYRDVGYVEQLIGRDTIVTMPPKTVDLFQDHGTVEDTLDRDVDEARRVLDRFAAEGFDYADITAALERQGVEKFAKSYQELLDGITAKRRQLVHH